MTTIESTSRVLDQPGLGSLSVTISWPERAFLARDSRRIPRACGHDLRGLFQWAAEPSLAVLAATPTHPELYRTSRRRGSEGYRSREEGERLVDGSSRT